MIKGKRHEENRPKIQTFQLKFRLVVVILLMVHVHLFGQFSKDSTKRVHWAGIPMISYNTTTGLGFGVLGQAYYKISKTDTISPSSSTGIFGLYTTNKTYFCALFQRLYFNQDRWRMLYAIGQGNVNFQYWQDLGPLDGLFIGFNTRIDFAYARVERKLVNQLYGGVSMVFSKAQTGFDLPDWVPERFRNQTVNMNNFGYLFNFDKREHQINPYEGYNIEWKQSFFTPWLHSDYQFNKIELVYNHYHPLKDSRHILATRVKADVSIGDVPFQGQNVVGQDDIRGYSSGKYRDNQVYAIQAEYRWRFYKKFGMVGFFGVASAVNQINDLVKNQLLPAGGVGFRFMMIEKERINVGFDVAKGVGDWGLYFRIGESFGR